jgi:uncharacterized protein YjiS (DUF1127 family)
MVITVIVLNHLWRVWRERENQRSELARMSPRELADIGLTDAERQAEVDAPFWRAVFAHYRRGHLDARARRARTQQAMARLSRMEASRDPPVRSKRPARLAGPFRQMLWLKPPRYVP